MPQDSYHFLKKIISEKVFIPRGKEPFVSPTGNYDLDWIFDFRKVLLQPKVLRSVTDIFLEKFGNMPSFQLGGIEVAAIPLVAGLVMNMSDRGRESNGFFIRKSRKKEGLLRMIEGEVQEKPIILIDDIMNTGKSFIRQVEVIESLGKKVDTVFSLLRFRDLDYYRYFTEKDIRVISIFTLDDFKDSLKTRNLVDKKELPVPMPFTIEWYFKSEKPNYYYVIPKSAPAVDDEKVYFGSDSGFFYALNQNDGSIAWSYKVGFSADGKSIFSSPSIYQDTIYFGSYDGNFYALDAKTGKKKWIFMEADWIGSSPCIALNLKTIFVGLEFGWWKKHGGIVGLDLETGRKKWEFAMEGLTHSSPAYITKHEIVVCGCNDFSVYALNAKTGALLWKFKTGAEVRASFAFDDDRGLVTFGSFDKNIYILNVKTGEIVFKIETEESVYSNPLVFDGYVYMASLDKKLYCIDLETGTTVWKFGTSGRIFASPEIIDGKVYIGSNDGRLYELEAKTGKNTAFIQTTERIVNKIAYNPKTNTFFLPTFANEIYSLKRRSRNVL